MADNVAITAGSGTTLAADDIGGVLTPRVKVQWGPDGTVNDADIASGKPLPVQLRTATGTATPLPALGTAGTAASDVITIQGIASGTVVPISSTALGTTAITRAAGASDSGTVRVTIDSGQLSNTGAAASSASVPVVLANDSKFLANAYETVAASQTAQALGATGGTGDWISGVLVIPATTSPGNVLLLDNATSITIFTGGASSVSNLVPFFIPLGMVSVSGAWKLTTGANVSCIGIGKFT
jgi:hypothetical protein